MMRLLIARGADPLFVHHSAYYDPTIGSVATANVGLDAPRLTETSTVLMAAFGVGGLTGEGWPMPDPKTHEAEALEAVKLALGHGVDVNAVNQFDRTCKVPWEGVAGTAPPMCGSRETRSGSPRPVLPTAHCARSRAAPGFKTVIAFLIEKGGAGRDVPVAKPQTVHQ